VETTKRRYKKSLMEGLAGRVWGVLTIRGISWGKTSGIDRKESTGNTSERKKRKRARRDHAESEEYHLMCPRDKEKRTRPLRNRGGSTKIKGKNTPRGRREEKCFSDSIRIQRCLVPSLDHTEHPARTKWRRNSGKKMKERTGGGGADSELRRNIDVKFG